MFVNRIIPPLCNYEMSFLIKKVPVKEVRLLSSAFVRDGLRLGQRRKPVPILVYFIFAD